MQSNQLSAYPAAGFELRVIERFVSLSGKRVLEIGCGDGRLTLEYAPIASSVMAIDHDRPSIDEAAYQQVASGIRNVDFRSARLSVWPSADQRLTWPSSVGPFDESRFGAWSMPFGEREAGFGRAER